MSKGIASLAKQVASEGRGGDSTLLHIHPSELAGIEAILRQLDPDVKITLNPETGMYEAFSWKKLLGAIGLGAAAVGIAVGTGGAGSGLSAKLAGLAAKVGSSLGIKGSAALGVKAAAAGAGKAATASGLSKFLGSVAVPALVSSAASQGVGALMPDPKNKGQQIMSDVANYKQNLFAPDYARQRFAISGPPVVPVYGQPQQQQPVQQGPQPQGIVSTLGMGTPSLNPPDEEEDAIRSAQGGKLEPEEEKAQKIIRDAMDAIRGEGADPEGALNTYIAYYGKDALQDLYKRMSGEEEEVPEEEEYTPPEGMIKGPGNGMDDMATARMARGGQKVLLSNDEFIIPADVVSGLGDGSSEAGARKLYAMMDRVRKDRTGTTKQPGKVKDSRVLPA